MHYCEAFFVIYKTATSLHYEILFSSRFFVSCDAKYVKCVGEQSQNTGWA
jgi:hypothetical protein